MRVLAFRSSKRSLASALYSAARGGALPEVAADAAEIEPSFEVASWTKTLERLLQDQDRLDELRAKGRKRVDDFCWKETAEQTLEAYRRAVDAG